MAEKDSRLSAELVAPCGVNCALCYAHQRQDKPCPGCNGPDDQKPKHCVKCAIYLCETRKAVGGVCTDCPGYPCKRMRQLDTRYRKSCKISLLENQKTIAAEGMDAFLEWETGRAVCPECGHLHASQDKVCQACGLSRGRHLFS